MNNHKLTAESFITAERLNDMNTPAEEEATKFLSGQPGYLPNCNLHLQQLMKLETPLTLK
jgi:hypothetical protein